MLPGLMAGQRSPRWDLGVKVDLNGKVALVTGASSGFGRRFAQVLAANGAHVHVAARRLEPLEALVDEIVRVGGAASAVRLDVSQSADVSAVLGRIGQVHIVVNNAGVAEGGRALDLDEAELRRIYDINVYGSWFVAQHAARSMVDHAVDGSIINIASITAFRPGTSAAYATSKAAVVQMTKALAREWARHGIRVNAMAPGFFETDMTRELVQSEFGQSMLKRVPQRRFGDLRDLDGPLLLLASDASAYMTGSVITVDGGHLCSML
jgi:NAD(P)-dependent dehydrogenase (short-subunit alcohol dehydrogenase family)